MCFGEGIGQACTKNLDCAVGFYCKDSICNQLLADGSVIYSYFDVVLGMRI